jgi:DNA-binding LacI/PurR family transcriptional regulator
LATLDQGLDQLERRGLIERRARSGIFVLSATRQHAIGLVLGWDIFSNRDATFYSILLDHCAKRAHSHQERFSFYLDLPHSNSSGVTSLVHQDLVDALAAGKLDGLLVASPCDSKQEHWLRNQGIPTVCLNLGTSPGNVTVDLDALIRLGARELKKRGCRKIGIMSPRVEHVESFRQASREIGFPIDESWILCRNITAPSESHETMGVSFARQLLGKGKISSRKSGARGLIITDDIVARGTCGYFASHAVVIGKDLLIASHSNKGSSALADWEDRLILCEIDPGQVAEEMFSMLQAFLDRSDPPLDICRIRPRLLRSKARRSDLR